MYIQTQITLTSVHCLIYTELNQRMYTRKCMAFAREELAIALVLDFTGKNSGR